MLAMVVLAGAGCGSPTTGATPSPTASYKPTARPSSPARVRFVQPQDQAVLPAGVVHIELALDGGTIVNQTTTHITPTTGHIHFLVNGKLVAMNYSTMQDIPLTAGLYRLTAEFVAADHVPFNPRVTTSIAIDVR